MNRPLKTMVVPGPGMSTRMRATAKATVVSAITSLVDLSPLKAPTINKARPAMASQISAKTGVSAVMDMAPPYSTTWAREAA